MSGFFWLDDSEMSAQLLELGFFVEHMFERFGIKLGDLHFAGHGLFVF